MLGAAFLLEPRDFDILLLIYIFTAFTLSSRNFQSTLDLKVVLVEGELSEVKSN